MRSSPYLLFAVSLAAVPGAYADGMLDPSFGNGGLVTTAFPGPFSSDKALSVVVLPDGRAVAAGSTNLNLEQTAMAVARYLFSGALDTSFGGGGLVTIHFPHPPIDELSTAEAVLLQPDGRLVVVGSTSGSDGNFFALARLNADGSLDTSFGSGGWVMTPFPGSQARAGFLQPDGRIVAVGQGGVSSIGAARYNVDGSLDPTFGIGGIVWAPVPGSFEIQSAALQPDGKIVIAGTTPLTPFLSRDFALIRLLPNGAPDPSFDGDGLATAGFGQIETGMSVVVLGDGRLVLAGWRSPTTANTGDFALVRFLANGSLDTTFGTGGLATADSGVPDLPEQLIGLPNGKLLVAGFTNVSGASQDFLQARFHMDGALDASFGTGGFLRTDFNGTADECHAVAIAGPDLVLTAGAVSPGGFPADFGLARYIMTIPVELLTLAVE